MTQWLPIAWCVEALIGASLLMLLVLAIRRPVARLWGAHYAYALWALPLSRMLMPAIPGWTPLYQPVAGARPDGGSAVALVPAADAPQYSQPLPPATLQMGEVGLVPDWPALLVCLWAVGAALFLAVQWRRHAGFIGRAVADGERLTMVGDVEVIVSPHVPGPMAAGILKRRILLPADFMTRYSPAERRLALLHEGAHHDRRDLAANLAGLLVLAAHWWNPIAHAAWRAFRSDQELACDATVLAGCDGATRAAYAGAVLKSAVVATPVAACALNYTKHHKKQLKDRLAMMKDRKFGLARRLAGTALVAGIATAALAATASGAPPEPPRPPAPPAPPAAPAAPVAPPAPPAPPAAPQAPTVQKLMVIKHKDGAMHGRNDVVRVIIKDGALANVDVKGDELAGLEKELAEADGRRMVMIRRHAEANAAEANAAEANAAEANAAEAAAAARDARAHMAAVRADLRARCEKDGVKLPADADIAQLATCGRDIQKEMREAMATARKAINDAKWLSTEERARALRGLEQAQADIRREVVVTLDK
jgi:beta-lactamase regulating signal transducer with metallopeptidase domain